MPLPAPPVQIQCHQFEPVPPVIMQRVPLDVWLSIMRWIHPRAAFRLATVSKAFKNMIYSSSYAAEALQIYSREHEGLDLQNHAVFLSVPSKEFQDTFARMYLTGRDTYSINHLRFHSPWVVNHSIPLVLCSLTDLKFLSFCGILCNGPIPREIGNLQNLNVLRLCGNRLSGSIPSELGLLQNLRELSLCRNWKLSGSIPGELGNLTLLKILDLRCTAVEGPIPAELGNLRNLETLDLSECKMLICPLPPALGKLTALTRLIIKSSSLIGHIPRELAKLENLQVLRLSQNNLEGKVPIELNELEHLQPPSLYGNKDLTRSFRWRNPSPTEETDDEDSVYAHSESSSVDE